MLADKLRIAQSTATAGGTDPYFANVSLLLHMDGADGSTTFTDSSSNNVAMTRTGNTQISTAQSKFGGASALFDGTGDTVQTPSNALFAMGTGSFTLEAWFRRTATAFMSIISTRPADIGYVDAFTFSISSTNVLSFFTNSTICQTATNVVSLNTWHHIAAVKNGTNVKIYVDGVEKASGSTSQNFTRQVLVVGGNVNASLSVSGYIDDVRITKGIARYTTAFTPPTAAFPDA